MHVTKNDVGETEASGSAGTTAYDLSGINIEPTKNGGFTVRVSYRPKQEKARKGDSCGCGPSWCEPDNYAFTTFAELVSFLQKEFGGTPDAAPSADAVADASDDL